MALSAHLHDVFFHPGAHQTREYCEDHLRLDLHQVFGERIDAGAYFPRHGNRISGKKLDLIENQGWRLLFFGFMAATVDRVYCISFWVKRCVK